MKGDYSVLQLDEILSSISAYCAFSLGKQRVLETKPYSQRLVIERELERTREAIELVVAYSSFPLGGISDISEALAAAGHGIVLSAPELMAISRHAYACQSVIDYLKKSSRETPEIQDLVQSLHVDMALSQEIDRCLDETGQVRDSASPKLKTLRKNLIATETKLRTEADRYTRTNAAYLSENIITLRNDRFVVLAKSSARNQVGGFIHGESNSGQTVYVEPEVLFQLNNERATVLSQIEEEIRRILAELSRRAGRAADAYLANLSTLAILDSLNAKALWARKYDAVCARLAENLSISYARHPLIDQKSVVSNSYHIYPDKKMLLITGPNTGGKTVSLKIIALFSLMTYCGLPLPCEEAEIPLYDEIYLDIGDQQTILASLSTFSGHMKNLIDICESCTEDSLVILDELCGGTDPREGEALAIAILDYLREKKCTSCITTHYSRLKTYAKKYPEILEASVEFDADLLQPTYRYLEGITGQSNALEIAARLGLNKSIIDRAKELKTSYQTREESLLESLESSLMQARLHEDELRTKEKDVDGLKKQLEREIRQYTDKKDELMAKAQKEADAYLDEVRSEADVLLKQLRETGQLHEAIDFKHDLDKLSEKPEEEKTLDEQEHEFKVGDLVQIKNSNQRGNIESLDRKKVTVNVNGLRISAKTSDLLYIEAAKPQKKAKSSHIRYERPESMSLELNLIGERVSDALPRVDKYISDAVLMKAPFVRIIHGYGTGTLRKAIWEHLKNNRYIESMRLGQEGEGSSGATVVTLKQKKK